MAEAADDLAPFESPKLLIEGAKASLLEFEAACDNFIKGCRYEVVSHTDPKTREQVFKLRFKQRMPGALRVKASGILNDLRHALDQAVCDAAIALGRGDAGGIYFPLAKTASDLEGDLKGKLKGVHADLVALLRSFKPHYGGDDQLYAVARLAGANKHQRVLRISLDATAGQVFSTDRPGQEIKGPGSIGPFKWNETRNEMHVARIGVGGKMDMDFAPRLQIVLGTGEPPLKSPAASVLSAFASKVESIVLAIEAETTRILGGGTTPPSTAA
jgi:hypothetical protein